jgi:hypothetical protein
MAHLSAILLPGTQMVTRGFFVLEVHQTILILAQEAIINTSTNPGNQ